MTLGCYAASMQSQERPTARVIPGLCGNCQHAQQIESDRGTVFLRCELTLTDRRFPKYPRLPVLVCSGYAKKTS